MGKNVFLAVILCGFLLTSCSARQEAYKKEEEWWCGYYGSCHKEPDAMCAMYGNCK